MVGAGAAPGSEPWVAAQQALTRLDELRVPITQSLADLDALETAEQTPGAIDPLLDQAVAEVSGLDARTAKESAALAARISGR